MFLNSANSYTKDSTADLVDYLADEYIEQQQVLASIDSEHEFGLVMTEHPILNRLE